MFRVSERLARKQKHTLDFNQQTSWREEESGASMFPCAPRMPVSMQL